MEIRQVFPDAVRQLALAVVLVGCASPKETTTTPPDCGPGPSIAKKTADDRDLLIIFPHREAILKELSVEKTAGLITQEILDSLVSGDFSNEELLSIISANARLAQQIEEYVQSGVLTLEQADMAQKERENLLFKIARGDLSLLQELISQSHAFYTRPLCERTLASTH